MGCVRYASLLGILIPLAARAADLPVTYLVDAKTLRTATATTPLTFILYSDAACSSAVATQNVNAGDVNVIEQLRRLVARPAPKPPTTARITTMVSGVGIGGNLWLQVTGTGVTPVGGACQAQTAQLAPHLGVPITATIKRNSATPNELGGCIWKFVDGPLPNHILTTYDRTARATMDALDCTKRYTCTVGLSSGSLEVFDVSGCSAVVETCSDGLKNQDESDVDCGGTNCAPCVGGKTCNASSDCYTTCASGHCTACSLLTTCGGPCPGCADYLQCSVNSDCQSGHCQSTAGVLCALYPDVCVPAHCYNGVLDSGETGIDCGGFSLPGGCRFIPCSTGESCLSSCDCSIGCSGGVCQ